MFSHMTQLSDKRKNNSTFVKDDFQQSFFCEEMQPQYSNNIVCMQSSDAKLSLNTKASLVYVEPKWKKSIQSKVGTVKSGFDKAKISPIYQRYEILKKSNPKLSCCIKLITQQIKSHILNSTKQINPIQYFPLGKIQDQAHELERNSKQDQKILYDETQEQISIKKQHNDCEEVHKDQDIIKQSCFRSLLKATQIDNDVASDEEDLNVGIRYMYGELLYSVGNQMVNQREKPKVEKTKIISKKNRKIEHNKENIDTNNIVYKQDQKSNLKSQKHHQNKSGQFQQKHLNEQIRKLHF